MKMTKNITHTTPCVTLPYLSEPLHQVSLKRREYNGKTMLAPNLNFFFEGKTEEKKKTVFHVFVSFPFLLPSFLSFFLSFLLHDRSFLRQIKRKSSEKKKRKKKKKLVTV